MLHVIRRIFLVTGALALAVPSLSAVLFACPQPAAHSEAVAPAADRHEAGHASESGARSGDPATPVDGVRQPSPDAHTSCEHPCPDSVTCIAGMTCASAPTVATVPLETDVSTRPRQGIDPAATPLVPSLRDAPELPPPRL